MRQEESTAKREDVDHIFAKGYQMKLETNEKLLVVDAVDEISWDDTAGVVVVGYGGAGACAAIEAKESGADVLVLDRFGGGGATAWSGGIVYAGNTRHIKEAGYEDSADNMYNYLIEEVGDAMTDETIRRFCDESASNIEWLEKHGLEFGTNTFEGKTTYPPKGIDLYFSGQEKVPRFAEKSRPAPRGHRVVGEGWTGKDFYKGLRESCESLGVRQQFHTIATRLVVDQQSRVVGLEVKTLPEELYEEHQSFYTKVTPMAPFAYEKFNKIAEQSAEMEQSKGVVNMIRAVNGVVLSTGGYSFNTKLQQRHMPTIAKNAQYLIRFCSLGCDGSGIEMAQSVGAELRKMDNPWVGRTLARPDELCYGIAVNQQGKRFINEDAYVSILGKAIAQQEEAVSYLVMSSESWWSVMKKLIPIGDSRGFSSGYMAIVLNILFGGTKRATTLEKLAEKCGIDPEGLVAQVQEFDQDLANDQPDKYGKNSTYMRSIKSKSYYAVNIGMPNKLGFMMFFTLGGASVDQDTGAVLNKEGASIEGLYAAGRTAIGLCSNDYFASGTSLADCVFSGRRAGRACATR